MAIHTPYTGIVVWPGLPYTRAENKDPKQPATNATTINQNSKEANCVAEAWIER